MDLSHNCSLHGGMSEVCENSIILYSQIIEWYLLATLGDQRQSQGAVHAVSWQSNYLGQAKSAMQTAQ